MARISIAGQAVRHGASALSFPTGPNWKLIGPAYWPAFKSSAMATIAGGGGAESVSTFGTVTTSGDSKWSGGFQIPSGFIYGSPRDAANFLKIDPTDDSFSEPAATEISNAYGGFLATNEFVYFTPYTGSTFAKLDTSDDSLTTFGGVPGTGANWFGGAIAPNGSVYAPCYSHSHPYQFLKTDTTADTVSAHGTFAPDPPPFDVGAFTSACLAPNGFIYCFPFNASHILKIDPSDDSAVEIAVTQRSQATLGCALSPANECIYAIPHTANFVLKLDTSDDSVSEISVAGLGTTGGGRKFAGCRLAPNGKIYCAPYQAEQILVIDTSDDSVSLLGDFSSIPYGTTGRWFGIVGAQNGILYGMPRDVDTILRIDTNSVNTFDQNVLLSAYWNQF